MSLAAKIIFLLILCSNSSYAKDIFILVVGQSIASNCNEHKYNEIQGVYQIDLEGKRIPASDPFLWADCSQGSMWMPLGDKIISSGLGKTVTIMPIGIGGTSVSDWLPQGRAFKKLEKAIIVANSRSIRFDYAFWHQGSSDVGRNPKAYASELSQVLRHISLNLKIDKWIIARHSKCGASFDKMISKAQHQTSINYYARRFPGPDNNALGDEFRFDRCHLNKAGQERMAELWFDSIIQANKVHTSIQKESLLHFFRNLF